MMNFLHSCVRFLGTAEALAAQVTEENFEKGLIYPPFTNIREISAQIAAKVACKAYELGESPLLQLLSSPNFFSNSTSFINHFTVFATDL
jgi:hypothetical protein